MSSIYSNSHTVNTAMFMKNLINGMMGKYSVNQDFTLNNKYTVLTNETLSEIPMVGYIGIGRGGCDQLALVNQDDGLTYYHTSPPKIPSAQNLDIFDPVPLRAVPKAEYDALQDKSNFANYRMRTIVTINGVDYYYWYLKKIDLSSTLVLMNEIHDDGSVYQYSQNGQLLQTPLVLNSTQDLESKLVAFAKAKVTIVGSELREYIAANSLSDDEMYFNELGVYTGADVIGGPDYNEAVGVQLAIHRTFSNISLADISRAVELDVVLTNGASIATFAQT